MGSCNFLVILSDAGLCLPSFTRHDAKKLFNSSEENCTQGSQV